MSHKFSFVEFIYRGPTEREYEVEVTYSVTPFVAATYMQPAEGGEVELLSITGDLEWAELTEAEVDRLYDAACDRAGEDLAAWHAEAEDYRADMRRDEALVAEPATVPARRDAA